MIYHDLFYNQHAGRGMHFLDTKKLLHRHHNYRGHTPHRNYDVNILSRDLHVVNINNTGTSTIIICYNIQKRGYYPFGHFQPCKWCAFKSEVITHLGTFSPVSGVHSYSICSMNGVTVGTQSLCGCGEVHLVWVW